MLKLESQIEFEERFQKKLQVFNRKFPTEESCVEAIYKSAKKNEKIKCYYCGSPKHSREFGSRTTLAITAKKKPGLPRTHFLIIQEE